MWDLREKAENPCFTASSSRGNVMVCFSPDDLYLLVSAIDNEVKQLWAVDGRLHMNFNITSTGSAHNYTRSYYMNGKDYIISGSCDQHVVRICCGQTGRRLRDVYIEGTESENSIFVQSLRGGPFRHFNFSVLTTSMRPTSRQEIVKVSLLASSHDTDESSNVEAIYPYCDLGG